jgi:hypothetical protein
VLVVADSETLDPFGYCNRSVTLAPDTATESDSMRTLLVSVCRLDVLAADMVISATDITGVTTSTDVSVIAFIEAS